MRTYPQPSTATPPLMRRLVDVRKLAFLVALVLLAAAPSAHAASRLVIRGAGFGHGIGMSQYGAYGLALQGGGYRAILARYYTGTPLARAGRRPKAGPPRRGADRRRAARACAGLQRHPWRLGPRPARRPQAALH